MTNKLHMKSAAVGHLPISESDREIPAKPPASTMVQAVFSLRI